MEEFNAELAQELFKELISYKHFTNENADKWKECYSKLCSYFEQHFSHKCIKFHNSYMYPTYIEYNLNSYTFETTTLNFFGIIIENQFISIKGKKEIYIYDLNEIEFIDEKAFYLAMDEQFKSMKDEIIKIIEKQ
jgi:hypothetical protein